VRTPPPTTPGQQRRRDGQHSLQAQAERDEGGEHGGVGDDIEGEPAQVAGMGEHPPIEGQVDPLDGIRDGHVEAQEDTRVTRQQGEGDEAGEGQGQRADVEADEPAPALRFLRRRHLGRTDLPLHGGEPRFGRADRVARPARHGMTTPRRWGWTWRLVLHGSILLATVAGR
jgi:hypothetical protein